MGKLNFARHTCITDCTNPGPENSEIKELRNDERSRKAVLLIYLLEKLFVLIRSSIFIIRAKATPMGTSDEIREVALTLAQDNLDDDAAEEAVSQAMWLIKETVAREELSGPLGLEVGKFSFVLRCQLLPTSLFYD